MMVSMLLEDMLRDMGHVVVGPATRLEIAIESARTDPIDGAILDLNLNGVNTYKVAEVLRERNIPFIFATGYGSSALVERFRSAPVLQKPFLRGELEAALKTIA
jgi:DNA-binding response OmpR family regulator